MATAPSASAFAKLFRDEGLVVVEVGNWETHNRNHMGPWGPVNGVMIHHTVTSGSARTVQICRDGYTALPGPLCHGVITKDGRVHLVGYGRANHAGLGDPDVLAAVIAERALPADNEANTDGNARFYGFECENLGDGKDPWPEAQLLAIEKVSAALCRYHDWAAGSVIGHLEWQPGKVDPRGFSMQTMRGRIAARLDGNHPQEDPMAGMSNKDIAEAVWGTDGVINVPWGSDTNPAWMAKSILVSNGELLRQIRDRVKDVQAREAAQTAAIGELAKTVAALAANTSAIDPDALVARIQGAIESVTVRLDVPDA